MPIAEIRARRERLIADAQRQRALLADHYAGLRGAATLIDRGIGALVWLRERPLYLGMAAAVLMVLRPRRMIKLAGRGLVAWRTARAVHAFLRERGLAQ